MSLLLAAAALVPLAAWASQRQADALPVDAGADVPDPAPDRLAPPTFLESIGILSVAGTRGERNNNPGNIRISPAAWQGKVPGADAAFETFADPQSGIRALAKLLKNYAARGLSSVREIVGRYAPSSENNTAAYVNAVAASMGVGPDAPLDLSDPAQLAALVQAIIRHENGRVIYSSAEISAAVGMV